MSKINPENKCADIFEEVPFENDALNIMFKMQNDLQTMYGEKRGSITPKSEDIQARIKESIYHFSCLTAEYFELMERYYGNNEKWLKEDEIEIQMELIDCFHFLMNIFLYLGIEKFKDIDIHDVYPIGLAIDKWDVEYMNKMWATICYNYGSLLDSIPYKYWKTYNKVELDDKVIKQHAIVILRNFFQFAFVFDIDKEKFYSLYVSKNRENFDRQERGY